MPAALQKDFRRVALADAHGHQDVEERSLHLDDARAHFIDEIEVNFIFGKSPQRCHEELGIERDGELAALSLIHI